MIKLQEPIRQVNGGFSAARLVFLPGSVELVVVWKPLNQHSVAKEALLSLIAFFGLLVASAGCASIQVTDAVTGLPRVIGWGSATNISVAKGSLYRIRSPGISLRLHSFAPGLTLGWHETLLFIPNDAKEGQRGPPRPVAIRTRDYGFGLAPYSLMVGGDSTLGVYEPTPGGSFAQTIQFVPDCLINTVITKEQIK